MAKITVENVVEQCYTLTTIVKAEIKIFCYLLPVDGNAEESFPLWTFCVISLLELCSIIGYYFVLSDEAT